MKKYFTCPDGGQTEIKSCLDGNCRMGSRCAPLPFLIHAGEWREYKGHLSVTRCLLGTREFYLQNTIDFAIKPASEVWAILGGEAHEVLEKKDNGLFKTELYMQYEGISGMTDLVELQPNGERWLIDHKYVGSFAVSLALGIKYACMVDVLDSNGNQIIGQRGKYAGQPKKKKSFQLYPKQADTWKYSMQLGMYALAYEDMHPGQHIDRLMVFFVPRDGGLQIARERGITENMYYVEIPRLSDEIVLDYFERKRIAGEEAMANKRLPPVCNSVESWDGRKCQQYCDVKEACAKIGDNPHPGGTDSELSNF